MASPRRQLIIKDIIKNLGKKQINATFKIVSIRSGICWLR